MHLSVNEILCDLATSHIFPFLDLEVLIKHFTSSFIAPAQRALMRIGYSLDSLIQKVKVWSERVHSSKQK